MSRWRVLLPVAMVAITDSGPVYLDGNLGSVVE